MSAMTFLFQYDFFELDLCGSKLNKTFHSNLSSSFIMLYGFSDLLQKQQEVFDSVDGKL